MLHVVNESIRIYAGTDEEILIYYDDLKSSWAIEAKNYLGFQRRLLRAYDDVHKGTLYQKVVGNSPELAQGLDAHGFSDVEKFMQYHVSLTNCYYGR